MFSVTSSIVMLLPSLLNNDNKKNTYFVVLRIVHFYLIAFEKILTKDSCYKNGIYLLQTLEMQSERNAFKYLVSHFFFVFN